MTSRGAALQPAELLAALTGAAGSPVEGMHAAGAVPADAPRVEALGPPRAAAVLAAWSGTQLHAGERALLETTDPDLALLVGDWCLAYALQALAQSGDLAAIGDLADAIARCALTLDAPDGQAVRAGIWANTASVLADIS